MGVSEGDLPPGFDLGITHFDLANNYGPPYGAAETNFGRILATDFAGHRDELMISTKAGYDMWPGPYGDLGSRKYLLASLDQSLSRMGLDYVDIFYSHRADPDTPLEETVGALASAVTRARRCMSASRRTRRTHTATAELLAEQHVPLLIHQPSYSMFNRWTEAGLSARHTRRGRCRLHRVLTAGPRHADRSLPQRHPVRLACRDGWRADTDAITEERLDKVRALNTSPNGVVRPSPSSPSSGHFVTHV